MKKLLKSVISLSVIFMMSVMMVSPTFAVKSYNVSFKAGSQGTFANGTTNTSYDVAYNTTPDADTIVGNLQVKDGYYFNGWNYTVKAVTQKASYVAQYKRIVNEATYRVNYVDNAGNQLATQKVVTSNVGIVVAENALNIEGYAADAVTKTATLEKSGTEITFTYVSTVGGTVQTVIVNDTVVLAPTGTGGVAGGGQTTAGGTGGLGTEDINDTDTPLAGNDSDNIDDGSIPLSSSKPGTYWSLVNLVCAISTVVFSIYLLTIMKDESQKIAKSASIVLSVASVVLFLLTQNLTKQMVLVDRWTIVMAVVLVLNIGIMFVKYGTKNTPKYS